MEIIKSLKVRIYPKKDQIELLDKHFGCSRFIYNYFLDLRNKEYLENKKHIGFNQCSRILTDLKKENQWLNEVCSQSLQQSIRNLDSAYDRFFRKVSKFPKFKKKNDKNSFRTSQTASIKWDFENGTLKIPKFKEPFKFRGEFSGDLKKFTCVTISKTKTGKYYATCSGIFEIEEKESTGSIIGIDLGLKDLIIDSNGKKIQNPRFLRRALKKLKFIQRQHSKSKKGTSRRERKRKKLALGYEKVTNQRRDYLHKISSKLVDENQVIILEDLAVKNMIKNHCLAQAIQDVSWGTLISFINYKSSWHSRQVVKIDRFYPSSKTCSSCGWINQDLTLKIREWTCPSCVTIHDRDINAARNILRQGENLINNSVLVLNSEAKQKSQEALSLDRSMNEEDRKVKEYP